MTTHTRNGQPPAQIAVSRRRAAEWSVLGGILLSDRAMYGLVIEDGSARRTSTASATHDRRGDLSLHREGEPVGVLTVAEQLRSSGRLEEAGDRAAIDELTGGVPGLGAIRRCAQIVRGHALMRRLLTTTYEIQASVLNHDAPPGELVDRAEERTFSLREADRAKRDVPLADAISDELERIREARQSDRENLGLTCGLPAPDELTGGCQPG